METVKDFSDLSNISQDLCNFEEKLKEIWKIVCLQSTEIKLIKDLQKIELQSATMLLTICGPELIFSKQT